MNLEELKYPIGKFEKPGSYAQEQILSYSQTIRLFPEKLMNETRSLNNKQLDTPYRPDGWTIRQVVHHCADSHMNAFCRFKLALTEKKPTIKAYAEALWAKLPDSAMPIGPSLQILEGVHARMVVLWESLSQAELEKIYIHPQYQKEFTLAEAMALYSWHCEHHLAHITSLKKRNNW